MTEKTKNDQKNNYPYRQIAMGLFLGMMSCLGLILLIRWLDQGLDRCPSINDIHYGFQVAGRVVDTQGQAIEKAQVGLMSDRPRVCIDEVTFYQTVTNEVGEFSFDSVAFAYSKRFFISIKNADGCQTYVIYDGLASSELRTITLNCASSSS